MVNDSPSDIKLLKAISLEGSKPWNISIKGYISDKKDYSLSTIKDVEFKKKEGIWFAHSRRNERGEQRDSKATYGIGVVTAINGRTLTINGGNILTSVGDTLLDLSLTNVGTIGSIGDGTIGLSHPPVGISVGDYLMGVKNPRVSGGGMRGYTLRMDLDTNVDEKVELFSVNSEVVKSSPF